VRLLVLGGTKFLGRGIVDAALERGHDVTLFNRGRTNPELYPEVERLRGDRDGDLGALAGRIWDAVIDPSGFVPRVVRASTELLRESGHYVFVSSISVYDEPLTQFDEGAPLRVLDDPASENVPEHYGELKAACEQVVDEVFPGRSTRARAGLIVGPHDPTDRFTYWPVRIAQGDEVIAPGRPERPWQFVDVRDLGAWLVHCAEHRVAGAFNATGPVPGVTAGEVLETCRTVAGSDAELVWIDDDFLVEREVGEWMELPLWTAESGPYARIHDWDVSRAVAAGLPSRPIAETVADTLAWANARTDAPTGTTAMGGFRDTGIDREKERRIIAEWRAR
jgi:nucleoside-diphosphate-sugar epimerase